MNLSKAIKERRSIRAFREESVEIKTVEEVLEMAIQAPSALNLQPYEFNVVMNEERQRLSRRLLKAYREKRIGCSPGTSEPLPERFNRRMEKTFRIMRPKIEAVGATYENFINEESLKFYGAPVAIVICIDKVLPKSHLVSIGAALGYLVLAAHSKGLGTCPIGLVKSYAYEVKDALNITDDKEVVIGVALGYPDWDSPVNSFKIPRDALKEVTRWI